MEPNFLCEAFRNRNKLPIVFLSTGMLRRWAGHCVSSRTSGRWSSETDASGGASSNEGALMERIQLFLAWLRSHGDGANDEDGQTMIEYGLIVALISIVAIVTLTSVGTNVKDVFNSVGGK